MRLPLFFYFYGVNSWTKRQANAPASFFCFLAQSTALDFYQALFFISMV